MATKALRFYRATALPSTANSAAQGDIYFIKPSDGPGQIHVCTSLNSSNIPQFVKYADTTVYTHPTVSRTNGTSTASPDHGKTFTAIDSITTNDQGHVTGVNTKTVTIPAETILNIVQNGTGYVSSVAKGTGSHDITVTRTALPTISVSDGSVETNKYISAISANGHEITVTKATLPSGTGGVSETAGKYVSAVSLSGHTLTAGTTSFITSIASNGNSSIAPTTAAVKQYVDNAIASAIHIKGTIGSADSGATVTALPKSAAVGDAYVVKTAGTYSDIKCEVGDIIICTTASPTAPTWTTVQNNLDVATTDKLGTIKIGFQASGQNYPVQLDTNNKAYVNVPWVDTDTKVTSVANHYTPAANSSSQLSVDASSTTAATWDTTSLVTGVNIQRDAAGHVTGVTVDSIKMPSNPNTHYEEAHTIKVGTTTVTTFNQKVSKTTTFATGGSGKLTVSGITSGTVTYDHAAITSKGTSDTKSLAHSGKFTYVSSVTTDGYGHVTAYNTQEATLPAQYSLPAATTDKLGGIKIGTSLEMLSSGVCNVVWTDFGSNS